MIQADHIVLWWHGISMGVYIMRRTSYIYVPISTFHAVTSPAYAPNLWTSTLWYMSLFCCTLIMFCFVAFDRDFSWLTKLPNNVFNQFRFILKSVLLVVFVHMLDTLYSFGIYER